MSSLPAAARLAILAAASPALAQTSTHTVALHAGDFERRDALVTVALRAGRELADAPRDTRWSAHVEIGNVSLIAQAELVRDANGGLQGVDVRWVEPLLEAREVVRRRVVLRPASPGEEVGGFREVQGAGTLDLFWDEQPVWRHVTAWDPEHYEETYKPFHHVYGLHGEQFLTKGTGGQYSHHRGIFLGWTKTGVGEERHNFWHMPASGRPHQLHLGHDETRRSLGRIFSRSVSTTRWITDAGVAVVEDERDLVTWRLDDGWLLDWELELQALDADVLLDGDPAHGGFQFRAAQSVAEAGACEYVMPEGAQGGEGDNWSGIAWVAGRFPIGERRYEVLFLDHPGNPRPTYNTRSYGRFGPFFRHELKRGEPLRLRYRLHVREIVGDPPAVESLEAEARAFADPVRVVVE